MEKMEPSQVARLKRFIKLRTDPSTNISKLKIHWRACTNYNKVLGESVNGKAWRDALAEVYLAWKDIRKDEKTQVIRLLRAIWNSEFKLHDKNQLDEGFKAYVEELRCKKRQDPRPVVIKRRPGVEEKKRKGKRDERFE